MKRSEGLSVRERRAAYPYAAAVGGAVALLVVVIGCAIVAGMRSGFAGFVAFVILGAVLLAAALPKAPLDPPS